MCTRLPKRSLFDSHLLPNVFSNAHAQGGEYGCWVGSGSFTEVFSSQARAACALQQYIITPCEVVV